MPEPVAFTSKTARFGLPLLYAAQAQKEFFVNQALAIADGLLHPAVEGQADAPPAAARDGDAWLVGTSPTGEWEGHAGSIALRQAGLWLFVTPVSGMRIYDRSALQAVHFSEGWQRPAAPALPTGGGTIDSEARTAISDLIDTLRTAGVLAAD